SAQPPGPCAARALRSPESLTEDLAEDIAGIATETAAAKFEMRASRASASALKTGKGITPGRLESLETRLARGVDLSIVEAFALLLVAEDLVSLVDFGKAFLRLRIIRPLVGMVFLGEAAKSRLYVLGRRAFRHAEHFIRVSHSA